MKNTLFYMHNISSAIIDSNWLNTFMVWIWPFEAFHSVMVKCKIFSGSPNKVHYLSFYHYGNILLGQPKPLFLPNTILKVVSKHGDTSLISNN